MLLGHQSVIENLLRLADAQRFASGYLFSGPAQVGKKLTALCLANYLETGRFEEGGVLNDLMLIAPDINSAIGIDAAREIKNFLWQKPFARYRVLVVDESDALTAEAQNAILKITEEPPASALLVLVTADPEKLLPTLRSRLQKVYFGAVPAGEIAAWLTKERKCPAEKARALAEYSCGRPGLALSLWTDKKIQKEQRAAEEFLKSRGKTASDLIKKLVEKDDFGLKTFLDAVILRLVHNRKKIQSGSWHAVMKLRLDAEYYNLNPRLQLENLARIMGNDKT